MSRDNLITIDKDLAALRKKSDFIDIENDLELRSNINTLEKFCKENEVMAMAANQLGILKRLVYLKNTNLDIINRIQSDSTTEEDKEHNEARVLINPVVLSKEGLTEYWENCASCLDNSGRVLRPYKINLEYYDMEGNKYLETFEGFEATVLSHELDHLDGILHIDIAEEVINMPKEERKKWRQIHPYKVYFEKGNYEELKLKSKVKVKNKI